MSAKHLDGARVKVAAAGAEIDKAKAALARNDAALAADRATLDQARASLEEAERAHVSALARTHMELGPETEKRESGARRHLEGAVKEVAKIEAAIAERQKIAQALQAALAVASDAQREVAALAKEQAAAALVDEIRKAWNKHVRPFLVEFSALNAAIPGKDVEPGLPQVDSAARQFEGHILGGELAGIEGGFLAADREALIGPPPKPRVFPPIPPPPEPPKVRPGSRLAFRH